MPAESALLGITVVIAIAAFIGAWFSFLRLPLILAYIFTGILVGPVIFKEGNNQLFTLLQDLGLSFLLFLVGLEIKISDLRQYGKLALKTGLAQIILTFVLGLIVSLILKFTLVSSIYIALALTFSSTVIVVKLLHEKRDFESLYGKITTTILLLQDIVAITFLVIVSGSSTSGGKFNLISILLTFLVGGILLLIIYFLSQKVLPQLFERLARNIELLFLSSIAWLLILVSVFNFAHFSIEIGAFLAGIGLASLKEEHQIAARVRPLRDFFIVIFFIILGSHIITDFSIKILGLALILSAFVLIIKPLVVIFALGRSGFKRRVGFMSGIAIAQVSEFSLVLMFLGVKNGHLSQSTVAVVTLTALITIAFSSYILVFATRIYRYLENYLRIFELKTSSVEARVSRELNNHVVLVGAGRLGWEVLKQLDKQTRQTLVIDFNPSVINALKEGGNDYIFGDITDPDIWEEAKIDRASLLICTVFDPEDTEEILTKIKHQTKAPVVFVTAAEREWAIDFYRLGADYVIVPRVLSGHQVAHLLTPQKLSEIQEGKLKHEHLEELRDTLKKFAL